MQCFSLRVDGGIEKESEMRFRIEDIFYSFLFFLLLFLFFLFLLLHIILYATCIFLKKQTGAHKGPPLACIIYEMIFFLNMYGFLEDIKKVCYTHVSLDNQAPLFQFLFSYFYSKL